MSILSGYKKFKKYLKTNQGYQLTSMKTYADTVHFSDETTLQNNLGDIKGITDSLTTGNSGLALSAKGGKALKDEVTGVKNSLGDQITLRVVGTTCYIERKE